MMIIQCLWEFQKILHAALSQDEELKKLLTGVFYKVPQDTNFPYAQLTLVNIKNHSLKQIERIKFTVLVNIVSRASGSKELYYIAQIIESIFSEINTKSKEFEITSLMFHKSEITQQNDGVTQIMALKYDSVITKLESQDDRI